MLQKITDLYSNSIQTHISASSLLPECISQAAQRIVDCLLQGHKIIVCGHGRFYINAQLLVANLLHRYEIERPSFPSVLLSLDSAVGSAIVSDNRIANFYQRQFHAVAQQGDILVAFSPFGNEEMILETINAALNKEINVIVFTGADNDYIQGFLTENDLKITVPCKKESRILEHHLFIVNTICELIDYTLFPHT